MLSSLSYSHILENLGRKAFQTGLAFFGVSLQLSYESSTQKIFKSLALYLHGIESNMLGNFGSSSCHIASVL